MYIEKLILENYQSVYVTLKSTRLEIDFTQRKNNICLFVGPNGCGKTSVLSTLTPFATLGNLDIRDSLNIVRPGHKGYKEIIIVDHDHRYMIKHFYTPSKESHSVKSYIEKDGVELNENGNVTSFKEIVKNELDIEMDYLKLVRLGNNVTNMLDLKATERKSFMSKLLDEVDVYLKYYKKISKELLEVKTIINHLLDKIKKTGIEDLVSFDDETKKMNDNIEATKKELETHKNTLAITNSTLSKLPSNSELSGDLKSLEKKLAKLRDKSSLTSSELQETIAQLETTIHSLELKKAECEIIIQTKQEILDNSYKERTQVMTDIKDLESSESVRSYEVIVQNLENGIKSKESKFVDVSYPYTKAELEAFMVFMEHQEDLLNTTYSFGKDVVNKVMDLMDSRMDVKSYIEKGIREVENHEYENACRIVFKEFRKKFSDLPPCEFGKGSCEYIQFYDEMNEKSLNRSEKKYDESVSTLQCMDLVYQNLKTFFDGFLEYEETFKKFTPDMKGYFQRAYVNKKIRNLESCYAKNFFYDKLSEITEYDNFITLKQDLIKAKADLEHERQKSYVGQLQKRLEKLSDQIDEVSDEISSRRNELMEAMNQLHSYQERLDDYKDLSELLQERDSIQEQYDDVRKNVEIRNGLEVTLMNETRYVSELERSEKSLTDQYWNRVYRINDYVKLSEELKKYKNIYDDLDAIKFATSTKEGIPLFFIKMYLKDTKDVTNELLDQVYHGRIYIDDFKISPEEFKIPFVNDGHVIDDVSYASQGQISFLSIALSFALSAQSLTKYNIILLDELDAALDTSNREKFIAILEYLIQMIDGEQVFLITHNNMFDMYPVDIVSLTGEKNPDMVLANYIDVKLDN